MFNKKSLTELVTDFLAKQQDREEKINARLSALGVEAEELKTSIEAKTREIVECELAVDAQGQEKCIKALRKLQLKLTEVQDLAAVYRDELGKRSFEVKDMERIKTTAARECATRYENIRSLVAESEEINQQIQQLQNRIKQIDANTTRARVDAEVKTLKPIIDYIDPRVKQLPYYDQERYLNNWIAGENEAAEQILTKYKNYKNVEEPKPRSLKVASVYNPPIPEEAQMPVRAPIHQTVNRPGA